MEIETTGSAMNQAMLWLTRYDEAALTSSSPNLLQRFALASIYAAAVADVSDQFLQVNDSSWLNNKNECSWPGITCDGQGMVTGVGVGEWFSYWFFCLISL